MIMTEILKKSESGEFILSDIIHELVLQKEKHLSNNYLMFCLLHDCYSAIRSKGVTEDQEWVLAQTNEYFLTEVQTQVCPVLDDLKNYKEAIQREKRGIKLRPQQAERTQFQSESR